MQNPVPNLVGEREARKSVFARFIYASRAYELFTPDFLTFGKSIGQIMTKLIRLSKEFINLEFRGLELIKAQLRRRILPCSNAVLLNFDRCLHCTRTGMKKAVDPIQARRSSKYQERRRKGSAENNPAQQVSTDDINILVE